MAWYDSKGNQFGDDQVSFWDSGGTGQGSPYFMGDVSSSPIALSQTDPTSGKGPTPWMNGFMDRWNQMGTIDGAPLYAALQKYGIDSNTFNWMDALNASDIGKGGNRQGFDLYSPERFTQAYLQGFGRISGKGDTALSDWMNSTGNSDTRIAQLDTGYADAKGRSDASAKMDWGSYIAPSLLAAPVAAGALLGAGAGGLSAAGQSAADAIIGAGGLEGGGAGIIGNFATGAGVGGGAGSSILASGIGGGAGVGAAGQSAADALIASGGLEGGGAGVIGNMSGLTGGAAGMSAADALTQAIENGVANEGAGTIGNMSSSFQLPNLPPLPPTGGNGSGGAGMSARDALTQAIDNGVPNEGAGTIGNMPSAGYLAQLAQTLGVSPDALTRALGTLGSAGLGAYASSQNTSALQALADRAWGAGQPSRDRFNAAMSPGFDLNSIPGYKSAMDTSAETYLRKLSAQGGNPAGIGAAPAQTQAYLMGTVGLPAWQNYAGLNSSAGGLGAISGQATGAGQAAATSNGNFYNAIGSGLSDLLNPRPTQAENFLSMAQALKAAGLA